MDLPTTILTERGDQPFFLALPADLGIRAPDIADIGILHVQIEHDTYNILAGYATFNGIDGCFALPITHYGSLDDGKRFFFKVALILPSKMQWDTVLILSDDMRVQIAREGLVITTFEPDFQASIDTLYLSYLASQLVDYWEGVFDLIADVINLMIGVSKDKSADRRIITTGFIEDVHGGLSVCAQDDPFSRGYNEAMKVILDALEAVTDSPFTIGFLRQFAQDCYRVMEMMPGWHSFGKDLRT